MVFRIPATKLDQSKGEDVFWARQEGPTDPEAAMAAHLAINDPAPGKHLFAYTHEQGDRRPLTKYAFNTQIHLAAAVTGQPKLKGHGLRIGGTLEYLLRGVDFEVVKSLGRWQGNSFLKYLRRHTQITAQYIQMDSTVHDHFLRRITIPPPPKPKKKIGVRKIPTIPRSLYTRFQNNIDAVAIEAGLAPLSVVAASSSSSSHPTSYNLPDLFFEVDSALITPSQLVSPSQSVTISPKLKNKLASTAPVLTPFHSPVPPTTKPKMPAETSTPLSPKTFPPQTPTTMPLKGARTAPAFNTKVPQHIIAYFRDLESLFDQARVIDNEEKKRYVTYYLEYNVAEMWEALESYSKDSFAAFKKVVSALYPGGDSFIRYTYHNLESLAIAMIQNFQEIADYLHNLGQASALDLVWIFPKAFQPVLALEVG
ncbi:hypothetical protein BD779DRAFT_1679201 [Infundibulicybe gibba]|nr:hypothetical protein BD779DRAFT_1679201 [Infundibulicybe gibba]